MPQTPRFYDPDYIASTIQESDNFISPNKARNYIINGAFDFWQRGTSFALNTNIYCADRFVNGNSADGGTLATGTVSRQPLTVGAEDLDGQQYFLRINNTSLGTSLGANSYQVFAQRIEDVRNLGGKTITISIWMAASTAKQVALFGYQYFGTGGSGSVAINCSQNGVKTLNSTITRYDFTVNVPSISGKTVGPDSLIEFGLFLQAGSTQMAAYGYPAASLGWGAVGTIDIIRFQVNEGSAVGIPFSRAGKNLPEELQLCQRYYEKSYSVDVAPGTNTQVGMHVASSNTDGTTSRFTIGSGDFKVTKRKIPDIAIYSKDGTLNRMDQYNNVTVPTTGPTVTSIAEINQSFVGSYIQASTTGWPNTEYYFHWTASAEL